jgi:hypothetical protein
MFAKAFELPFLDEEEVQLWREIANATFLLDYEKKQEGINLNYVGVKK